MIPPHLEDKIAALATSLGLYIYDIEFLKLETNHVLRISITRKAPMQTLDSKLSSVSLQDCQSLSEILSPMLDVEGEALPSYILEVSSPGLERTLKKASHYAHSLGEQVSVRLTDKRIICGVLDDVNKEGISVRTQHVEFVRFEDIKKVRVVFEF